MKKIFILALVFLLFTGCSKEISFENETFKSRSTLSCKDSVCAQIIIAVPIAKNIPIVADSINNKVFSTVRKIVYFGNNPSKTKDYKTLTNHFINSYEETLKEYPNMTGIWKGEIKGTVEYRSDQLINILLDHYTDTGGAHGYKGILSLLFNAKTGKSIPNAQLFQNEKEFRTFAEKEFRTKYHIPENANINATGFMFEEDTFQLPQNIFYTDEGLLLYYNSYEAASYADGPKEIIFSYDKIKSYLVYQP